MAVIVVAPSGLSAALAYGERHRDPVRALFLGGRSTAVVGARRQQEIEAVLGVLRLDPALLNRNAGSLSLGLKRIVEIARALATGATILCFDEPAAGLDEQEIQRLGRALGDVAKSGRTVVLIEHHMQVVLDVCDDVLLLDRGRVDCWVPVVDQQVELPAGLQSHMGMEVAP